MAIFFIEQAGKKINVSMIIKKKEKKDFFIWLFSKNSKRIIQYLGLTGSMISQKMQFFRKVEL